MNLTGKTDVTLSPRVHNEQDKEEWSILGNLPDDLLVQVLCCLPAELLIISKCVCKLWCHLITDVCMPKLLSFAPISGFFYLGDSLNIEYASLGEKLPCQLENQLLFEHNRGFVKSFTALMPFEPEELVDCCNGLLLFVMKSVPQYYICNPATKQLVEIPRDGRQEQERSCRQERSLMPDRSCFAALAFNPLESPHYKVVRVNHWRNFPESETVTLDVFSSESGKWLRHPVHLETTIKVSRWFRRCIYLNGVLYLLSFSKHLLHFDLNDLNAGAIELPKRDKTDIWGFIGVSKGNLYYSNDDGSTLFVWAFEAQRKLRGWILKHTICINNFVKDCSNERWRLVDSALFPNLCALDPNSEAIFIGVTKGIFRYNPDDKTLDLVYSVRPDGGIYCTCCAVFTYTPCLVILKNF